VDEDTEALSDNLTDRALRPAGRNKNADDRPAEPQADVTEPAATDDPTGGGPPPEPPVGT